jgi:hypothetical protein
LSGPVKVYVYGVGVPGNSTAVKLDVSAGVRPDVYDPDTVAPPKNPFKTPLLTVQTKKGAGVWAKSIPWRSIPRITTRRTTAVWPDRFDKTRVRIFPLN